MMDPEQERSTADLRDFSRKVQDARGRIDFSRQSPDDVSTPTDQSDAQPEMDNKHAEMLETLEELRVADEELRQQQEELLVSRDLVDTERQKYYELFDFAPDAYLVTDTLGVVKEANTAASQLLGVSRQFLAGKPISLFFEEGARAAHRHQLDQLCGVPRIDDWEIALRTRGGESVTASVSVGRITGKDKKITGFRWIIRDITRRKRAEEEVKELNRELGMRVSARTSQLAAANRIKDELLLSERKAREQAELSNRVKADFLALLSHEFRTPLQAIFGYTELLEREIHGPLNEAQRNDLLRIQRSEQHLLGLINTILDFAKLESGQAIDVRLSPVSMSEILPAMEALIGSAIETKGVQYEYQCTDSSIVALADPAKVQQIVLNLLANAIKFTDRGGKIALGCIVEADSVVICVSDTGRGIPPEQLEAIFEPFVQVKTMGTKSTGTGLGLAISRRLAAAMGGTLMATSEPGVGAKFTLRLPRTNATPKLVEESAPEAA